MEQTVKHAEKYLGEICSLLSAYTRKTAKLRDKADLLVAQLFDFSRTEDPELQIGLKNLAEDLAMVQDYRQAQVERLESRVVAPLKAYGDIVKNKRADLKKLSTDLNRELKELQRVEKIRLKNPADRQSIAEVSAQKSSNNAQRSIRQLEESITDFQKQKLEDIKMIFIDFLTVEMLFHAKALEVYTHTYHNLEKINTQKDLELFSGRIKMTECGYQDTPLSSHSSPIISRYSSPALASPKGQSLRTTLMSTTGQHHRLQHIQYPLTARRPPSTLQRQRGMEEEEVEDEEDEDEDEEEEEMYESEIEESHQTGRESYAAQYAQMRRRQM
ncbi:hypothetical protein Q8A73_020248 [Channa argus]|nr:hypothetical protein Q8A73_020248 [Channa argus]